MADRSGIRRRNYWLLASAAFLLISAPSRPVLGQASSLFDTSDRVSRASVARDLQSGQAYSRAGRFSRAIDAYSRVLEIDATNSWAHLGLGSAYEQLGFKDRALEEIDKAIFCLKPNRRAEAYRMRADILARAGDFDRAIASYDRAIALNPGRSLTYLGRGYAWQQKDEQDRAIADATRAIEASPGQIDRFLKRASAPGENDRGDPVPPAPDRDLDAAIWAYLLRGLALEKRGNLDRAQADFERVLSIDPDEAEAYHGRGRVLARKGDRARALADFDRAIEREPEFPECFRDRAAAHLAGKEWDRAIANLDRVIADQSRFVFTFAIADVDEDGAIDDLAAKPGLSQEKIDRALLDFRRAAASRPDLQRFALLRRGKDAASPLYHHPIFDLSAAIRTRRAPTTSAPISEKPVENPALADQAPPAEIKIVKRFSIPGSSAEHAIGFEFKAREIPMEGNLDGGGKRLDQYRCIYIVIGIKDRPELAGDLLARGRFRLEKGDRAGAEDDFRRARRVAIAEKDRDDAARRLRDLLGGKPADGG